MSSAPHIRICGTGVVAGPVPLVPPAEVQVEVPGVPLAVVAGAGAAPAPSRTAAPLIDAAVLEHQKRKEKDAAQDSTPPENALASLHKDKLLTLCRTAQG